jgi:predicted RNase H-like nuclease (RuvC/YqgF family)
VETGTWLGFGALLVSAAGALNSMRAGRREDRSSAVTELQTVVQTLKGEIDRLKLENKESEEECRRLIGNCKDQIKAHTNQVAEMQSTIISQANQINLLERRQRQRLEGQG